MAAYKVTLAILLTCAAATAQAGALSAGQLVERVLARNPGIDTLRAAADAAKARVESAGALDDPVVSYAAAPNTAGGPNQGLNQNIQISQKIPWPGTLNLSTRMASADAESARRLVADLRLKLAARARAEYAQWYYVHRALAINAETEKLVAHLQDVATAAYASGQSPQQDVLQAQVESTRLRNQHFELGRRQRTVQADIDAMQNLEPTMPVPVPDGLPKAMALPAYATLREAALAHNPGLQSLASRVTASEDRVDLAHKHDYPQFNVMAGYNSFLDMPDKRFALGVAVNLPFGANHRGELGEAHARLQESEARLADARSRLLGDVEQAYATAGQARETIGLYEQKLLPLAKLNLQAAEADYGSGPGDFLQVITAERQYPSAELELARARADFFTQLAALDYRTGGAIWRSPVSATSRETTP